eukprot:5111524-Prymnesium_polylepis.1
MASVCVVSIATTIAFYADPRADLRSEASLFPDEFRSHADALGVGTSARIVYNGSADGDGALQGAQDS